MNRPIKVLLLDDESNTMIDFIQEAKSNRVIVKKKLTNADEGIKEIKENYRKYDAIILDALFFEKPRSPKVRDAGPLADTIREIEKLVYVQGKHLPHCIYTGQLQAVDSDTVIRNKEVFKKGRDQEEMFKYLIEEVSKSEDYVIKNNFNDVFEAFDYGFMPEDKMPDLIEILKKLESKAKFNQDDAFTPMRKMYEAFLDSFYEEAMKYDRDQDFVDKRLVKNGKEITGSWRYFTGLETTLGYDSVKKADNIFPKHLSNLINGFIYLTNNESHYDNNYKFLRKVQVTHYTYKSAAYALLELLLWYKDFCLENFKN